MLFNITKPWESWKLQKGFSDVSKIRYNKLNSKVHILCTCMHVIDLYFFTKAIALKTIFFLSILTIYYRIANFFSDCWSEKGKVPSFLPTYLLMNVQTARDKWHSWRWSVPMCSCWTENGLCYGQNCVPSRSYVETPTSSVTTFRVRAFMGVIMVI